MDYTRTWQEKILVPTADTGGDDMGARISRSDKQLVELVLSGDENAFEEIFDRHKRLVASVAARYFHRPEEIEELIQVAFTKMYLDLKSFRGAHDLSMAGWLGRITRNACFDMLRYQKCRPQGIDCELSDPDRRELLEYARAEDGGEQYHVDRDLADKLLACLAPDDRVLLQMIYIEGLNTSEAADKLGWAPAKTKLRAWRARNSLRKIVKRFL